MKKLTSRAKLISITALAAAIIITASVFLGIFLYHRTNPERRFYKAEAAWQAAAVKKVTDDFAIEVMLGKTGNTLTGVAQAKGTRYYENGKFRFDYDVELVYKELGVTVLTLKLLADAADGTTSIRVSKVSGLIDFDGYTATLSSADIKDADISMNRVSLYDTKNISIDKEQNYSIEGIHAFDYMWGLLSLVFEKAGSIDLSDVIKNRANFSRVRGKVAYADSFGISSIESTQGISAYISWEEADSIIDGIDTLPEKLLEIYTTKQIKIENVPILGSYTLDLADILKDGILINIRIVGSSRFEVIKK